MDLNNSKEQLKKELRTWIEIDTKAIDHNLALARAMLPAETDIMAVLKSNAYGHSLVDFAAYITGPGRDISWLGVDSIVEAIALRKEGIRVPILVMGYTLPDRFSEALEHNTSITISNFDALRAVLDFPDSTRLKIHIKIDTGLHRHGFLSEEIPELVALLVANRDRLNIEGLYTHLADAKRGEGVGYSQEQKRIFEGVKTALIDAGFSPLTHLSASPALIRFGKEDEKDGMVRVGTFLYGLFSSEEMRLDFEKKVPLVPVLSWKTMIVEVKKVPRGSSVGYNRSEVLDRDTVIGVCSVGYWHGYPSSLSSKGIVVVNGVAAKVLGRVSMDILSIDCTDCPNVAVGDEVTLISADPKSPASAQNVALTAGVSVQELLTRLNARMKRIYF